MPLNSPDYQTSFVKGTATLTIEETFSEDTAKYTCRATTPEGSVNTTATLRVKGQWLRCAYFVSVGSITTSYGYLELIMHKK